MKTTYLLPHKCQPFGWILLLLGSVAGLLLFFADYESNFLETNVFALFHETIFGDREYFKIIENSIADEIVTLAIIAGGILIGFSKEKIEDEFIQKLRTDSLIWAIVFNYAILIFAVLFVYDFDFFDVLVFNMFTPLLFFIFRFNVLKLRT
jgi:hypothetical protein